MAHADEQPTAPADRPRYPYSLLGVGVLGLVGWLLPFVPVTVPSGPTVALRAALLVPLVLLAPGYAVVAALAPEGQQAAAERRFRGLSNVERLTFSFVVSLVVVPLVGFGLTFTTPGVRLVPVASSVGTLTLVATAVALYRWQALPGQDRFSLGTRRHLTQLWQDLLAVDSPADYLLNAVLILSLVVGGAAVAYGAVEDTSDTGHTEVYLATEAPNGSLVLGDYPTNFTAGESRQVVVGLENRADGPRSYTVVAAVERVENGSVVDRQVLERYQPTLGSGERWLRRTDVAPTLVGEDLRLQYEVYAGVGPDDVNGTDPDYTTHLGIDVASGENGD